MENLVQHSNYSHGYQQDPVKGWKFTGYICSQCGRSVKSVNVLERHSKLCRGRAPSKYGREELPPVVNDVNGNPWKPLDFNLK